MSFSPFIYVKPKFAKNESIIDILYLFFDDIDHDAPTTMTAEQAKEIADFVNKYKDDVEQIIVHCDAGMSRSAGCAAAIMKYLFGNNESIFNSKKYAPNLHCYSLTLNAFYDFGGAHDC